MCTRALLEDHVRASVKSLPNVTFKPAHVGNVFRDLPDNSDRAILGDGGPGVGLCRQYCHGREVCGFVLRLIKTLKQLQNSVEDGRAAIAAS